jgi:hypothetical protein
VRVLPIQCSSSGHASGKRPPHLGQGAGRARSTSAAPPTLRPVPRTRGASTTASSEDCKIAAHRRQPKVRTLDWGETAAFDSR